MKILWFANTPCSAAEKLGMNLNTGGWLRSLEGALNKAPEVELAICFYWFSKIAPFQHNGTWFYPLYRKKSKTKIGSTIKRLFNHFNNDEKEITELIKVVNQFKPLVIHVHGTEDNFGLLRYSTNIPIVISIQGILNPYVEKYFSGIPFSVAYYYERLLYKLAGAGIWHNFRQFKIYAERECRILIDANYVIGRTDWDRRVASILAPKSKYFVGNEMLRSAFYENSWSKKQFGNVIQIVTTSKNTTYKGFETIVNIAEILKKNTDLEFTWKVIGLDEKSSIANIVKKWKRVNFKSLNIQLIGGQKESDLIETLLASDIYCQTSHIENSPNSLCESMILGMPIIATYVGGTSSLLVDKKEGVLIQEGEPFSFAGAIIELSRNFTMASEFGNAAKNRALKRHCRNSIRDEYLNTYKFISEQL